MSLKNIFSFVSWSLVGLLTLAGEARSQEIVTSNKTLYHSNIDELLTVQKISILPVMDNVGGIYSRPLELHLIDQVKRDHHWDYIQLNLAGPLVTPEELESEPRKLAQLTTGLDSDAVIATRVTKGPNGINLKLNMFLLKDSKLFARAESKNYNRFEIDELKSQVSLLFKELVSKLPYEGIVLSRQGNRVTVNLGKKDGIEEGKIVSVVQIVKANRHPKFNFLINSDKEILGKVKLLKIDETLSFGKILLEKESGVITKNAKIAGIDFVKYPGSNSLSDNSETQDELVNKPGGILSFGRNATAWLPQKPPTFGMVGATVGNSFYSYNMQNSEGLNSNSVFNPFIALSMELWITSEWSIHTTIRQGILNVSNPKSGSSPSDLSASMSFYEFLIGRKFRMGASVWGPQVEVVGGLANYDLKLDDSEPRSLTSTKYSGLKMGLIGSFPIDKKQEYSIGANLSFFFNPKVSEAPVSSGLSPDSSINQFGLFVLKKLGVNLKAQANLDFELFKTNFSGPATSSSQKYTNLNFGLHYMF